MLWEGVSGRYERGKFVILSDMHSSILVRILNESQCRLYSSVPSAKQTLVKILNEYEC